MRKFSIIGFTVFAAVFAMAFASPLHAEMKMVKKVDNFILLIDQSGSMAEDNAKLKQKKIVLATDIVSRLDKAIPPLDYTSGMYLFSPDKTVSAMGPYKDGALAAAAAGVDTNFHVFGRFTGIGNGLASMDPVINGLKGKTALVLFTDGHNNFGKEPVAQAKALYDKYGDNLCIHVVGFADTPYGQKVIDGIRGLSGCTVATDVQALAADAAIAQYAKDVFYDEVAVQPPMKAAPAPVLPAPIVAKEVITFSLHFGFDKHKITDEMIPTLEQAKLILEEYPTANYIISGHADSTGPEVYNQGLSERRAASVKNWLVENGVAASRLETVGYGETRPKYDNSTREGRALNRRVEIETK